MIEESSGKKLEDRFILHDECEKSKYINYLRAYLEVFGLDKITVCLFEELKLNPQQFMSDLCRQINVDGSFYENYQFKIYNQISKCYNRINISHSIDELTDEEIQVIDKLNKGFRPFNKELAATFNVDLSLWNI
jgi:hypothetical protein